MSAHVDDELAELALGTLAEARIREVEAHLAACRRCRDEAAAVQEAFALLALAVPPVAPPPALRDRLLASVTPNRFETFVDRVASALDVVKERARELLAGIDRADSWSPAPVAWSRFYHFVAGPRHTSLATVTGFVRLDAGTVFPRHVHVGREHVMILQGGFRDEDGRDHHAGEDVFMEAGTAHAFTAHSGEELIYLAIIAGGVEFDPPFEF